MTSRAPTMGRVSGRLRLAVAGAAVATVLTAATAAASPPTPMGDAAPMGVQAPAMTRPGARPNVPSGVRSQLPVFVLDKGRFTAFDAPGDGAAEFQGINNRGEIAGYTAARFGATEDADAHGFVLRRGAGGPVTRIDVPGALGTGAMGINDRGQIVGVYINPDAAPTPQSAGTPPRGRTA